MSRPQPDRTAEDAALRRLTGGGLDPEEYPHRLSVMPPDSGPETTACILWGAPWTPDALAGAARTVADGGGLMLLARDAGELVRSREAAEFIIRHYGRH